MASPAPAYPGLEGPPPISRRAFATAARNGAAPPKVIPPSGMREELVSMGEEAALPRNRGDIETSIENFEVAVRGSGHEQCTELRTLRGKLYALWAQTYRNPQNPDKRNLQLKARDIFEGVLSDAPQSSFTLMEYARLMSKMSRSNKAEMLFTRIYALNGQKFETAEQIAYLGFNYKNWADYFRRKGRLEDNTEMLRAARGCFAMAAAMALEARQNPNHYLNTLANVEKKLTRRNIRDMSVKEWDDYLYQALDDWNTVESRLKARIPGLRPVVASNGHARPVPADLTQQ